MGKHENGRSSGAVTSRLCRRRRRQKRVASEISGRRKRREERKKERRGREEGRKTLQVDATRPSPVQTRRLSRCSNGEGRQPPSSAIFHRSSTAGFRHTKRRPADSARLPFIIERHAVTKRDGQRIDTRFEGPPEVKSGAHLHSLNETPTAFAGTSLKVHRGTGQRPTGREGGGGTGTLPPGREDRPSTRNYSSSIEEDSHRMRDPLPLLPATMIWAKNETGSHSKRDVFIFFHNSWGTQQDGEAPGRERNPREAASLLALEPRFTTSKSIFTS